MQRLLGTMQRRGLLRQWLPRLSLERLWWYLALASVLMVLGQEIARSSTLILAAQAASDFEGFGDDGEELEDDPDVHVVVPPPPPQPRGAETDRGPPPAAAKGVQDAVASGEGAEVGSAGVVAPGEAKLRQDWWDEDEFEGFPEDGPGLPVPVNLGAGGESDKAGKTGEEGAKDGGKSQSRSRFGEPKGPQSYLVEASVAAFLVVFGITYYLGRKVNENIALSWAAQFAARDTIFDKNFSLLGTGDGDDSPLLLKEGQNVFKFYASGRRYCESLLATLDLQSRHDLIARMWYVLSPKKDELLIEVNMNDEHMEPFVFAVTRRKQAKLLHKECRDLQQFATILSSFNRKAISDEVAVISESREIATELMKDAVIDQLFGDKAFQKHGKYFVSLHFTDQYPEGSHRKVLQFKFVIPPIEQLGDMTRLISIVPYFIDVVGRFKLTKEAYRKAEEARLKIAKEFLKETQGARLEALQRKKDEKRRALEDVEIKLSPDALRRREEKERARQLKKSMPKVKMTRAH